jgi:hypothetical protein
MNSRKVLGVTLPLVLVVAAAVGWANWTKEPEPTRVGPVQSTVGVSPSAGVTSSVPSAPNEAPSMTEADLVAPGPPKVPKQGAYIGAWVQPTPYSQPGRVTAVRAFETSIGRPLDIVGLYRKVNDPFPTQSDKILAEQAILQLSWASPDILEVVDGKHDDLIRAKAVAVRNFGKPVLLRWRWEMDRPNLESVVHEPADFIRAWQRVHRIFDQAGATNVGWIWCPTAQGFSTGRAQQYYPGDNQVDWVCADVYPEKAWVKGGYEPFEALADPFVSWAAKHGKPVIIGEYGVAESYGPRRADWLKAMTEYVRSHPQIKALVYYAESRPESPAYYRFHLKGDPAALAALSATAADPGFDPLRRAER